MTVARQPEGEAPDFVREAARARWLREIPRWYSPSAHLAFPSLVGLGSIALAITSLRQLEFWQLSMIPLAWIVSNAVEWRAHRDILHHRRWPLEELYDRHTPNHHRVFVTGEMEIRSPREFRFVLLPFYAIVAIFALTAPIALALALFGQRNLAALFVASSMAYVVSYEWLHLAYHLPASTFIGRLALVRRLREHHAKHHDPSLMQRWNFNVTVPLWDWLSGTIHRLERPPWA